MQVKFKWGTKEQILDLMKVRPSITEAEVYFDKEDGSLYVVSFKRKNEMKILSDFPRTSFEDYIQAQLNEIEN